MYPWYSSNVFSVNFIDKQIANQHVKPTVEHATSCHGNDELRGFYFFWEFLRSLGMSSPRQKLNNPINNADCIMPLAKIKWRCNARDKYQALKMCRIYEIQDFIVKFPQLSTPLRSSFNFVMLVSQRGWISRRVVCFCHFYRWKKRDTWVNW